MNSQEKAIIFDPFLMEKFKIKCSYINIANLFKKIEKCDYDNCLDELDLLINDFDYVVKGIREKIIENIFENIINYIKEQKEDITIEKIIDIVRKTFIDNFQKEFGEFSKNFNIELQEDSIKLTTKIGKFLDIEKKWIHDLIIATGATGGALLFKNIFKEVAGKTGEAVGTILGGFFGAAMGSSIGEIFILEEDFEEKIDINTLLKSIEKEFNRNFNNFIKSVKDEILEKAKYYKDKINEEKKDGRTQ